MINNLQDFFHFCNEQCFRSQIEELQPKSSANTDTKAVQETNTQAAEVTELKKTELLQNTHFINKPEVKSSDQDKSK